MPEGRQLMPLKRVSIGDDNTPAETKHGVWIGIDPGASGGLASIALDGVEAIPMPSTERDVWDWLNWFDPKMKPFAVIELVTGHVGGGPICPVCKQPRNRSPGSSMFKFGRGVGVLTGMMIAAGIPFEEVHPATWQKGLGIKSKKKSETRVQWKNRLKSAAQRLYPSVKVTLATADALLLMTYCQRWREGML